MIGKNMNSSDRSPNKKSRFFSDFLIKYPAILTILGISLMAQSIYAAPCYPMIGGSRTPMIYPINLGEILIDNPEKNRPGQVYDPISWSSTSRFGIVCECSGTYSEIYYKADVVSNTYITTKDGIGFYEVPFTNGALAIGSKVLIGGQLNTEVPTPFASQSNGGTGSTHNCGGSGNLNTTGSEGNIYIYFVKPFVGSVTLQDLPLVTIYAGTTSNSFGSVLSEVRLSATIKVLQSCSLTDKVLEIDFNDIMANDIQNLGQRPGVSRNVTITIECNNVTNEAFPRYSLSLNGVPAPTNNTLLSTTNSDIGIAIEDMNNSSNRVTPSQGKIFTGQLSGTNADATRASTARLNTYPINITGQTPETGIFTGTATIKLEFN